MPVPGGSGPREPELTEGCVCHGFVASSSLPGDGEASDSSGPISMQPNTHVQAHLLAGRVPVEACCQGWPGGHSPRMHYFRRGMARAGALFLTGREAGWAGFAPGRTPEFASKNPRTKVIAFISESTGPMPKIGRIRGRVWPSISTGQYQSCRSGKCTGRPTMSLEVRCWPEGVVYSQQSSAIGSSIRFNFGRQFSSFSGMERDLMGPWEDQNRPGRRRGRRPCPRSTSRSRWP